VITEGNYLLMDGAFGPVRELLTECWYVDVDPQVRRERLLARHIRHGRTPDEAQQWFDETDEPNAVLIDRTSALADVVVRLP
jgi:pantothenate kinase